MNRIGSEASERSQSNRVLILGGSGFIGTGLTSLMTESSIPVRIGDIRASEAFPDWETRDFRYLRGSLGTLANIFVDFRSESYQCPIFNSIPKLRFSVF